ncbi:hypothetical protein [Candidatus Erwinia haradaeae]|uniref:hypothetical protein n=1 Tax=Candidatus Erwinia haradaeae TaxID=1922217 RepID=UPI0013009C6E|nr:hypothetical protein [Candidatus Erwinia haradaeae]
MDIADIIRGLLRKFFFVYGLARLISIKAGRITTTELVLLRILSYNVIIFSPFSLEAINLYFVDIISSM